jgi:predicted Zn-dependent protease
MKYLANQQIVAALFLSLTVGCSTLQSMPARMKSMVSRAPDSNDPLANVKANVSDDFKMAKRELKSADETLLKYAQMREDMGNHDVALDRYRELLADNPNNVGARLGIARIEYKNGRVHEAEEILKAAARRHPENQQVWIDMGQIQSERKEYGAAIQSLQKAVSID